MNDTLFIFDIGNVLLDFNFDPLQEKIARASGASRDRVRAEWSDEAYIAVETGRLDERVYFDRFCGRLGLTWTFDEWIHHWSAIYSPNPFGQALYRDLQRRGHAVAMLSNLAPHHVTAIERGIPAFFGAPGDRFFSFDLGLHKPNPEIYRAVCAKTDRQPEQCVFLDDVDENIKGAQSIGMHAMQVLRDNHRALGRFVRSFT